MTSPDNAEPSAARPYDAERARLRAAGLTDDEISRIFIARELGAASSSAGPAASAGAPGQGMLSGVTNNLTAVLGHVRGAIPTVARQILTVGDKSAAASARLAALLSLVAKLVVLSVLAYAVFQEWNQHIISATEIAAQQADKAKADAARAKAQAEGGTTLLPKCVADPDVSPFDDNYARAIDGKSSCNPALPELPANTPRTPIPRDLCYAERPCVAVK